MSNRNGKTKILIVTGALLLIAVLATIVIAATGTGLTGKTTVTFNLTYENAMDLSTIKDRVGFNTNFDWAYGTGEDQANLLYHDTVTLTDPPAAANDVTIDLYASGSLTDAFGNALTMSAVKLLYLKNNSSDAILQVFGGNDNDLHIVPDPNVLDVHPGGIFFWVCPTADGVVTSTYKNLYLQHNGTGSSAMDVDVVVMGLD